MPSEPTTTIEDQFWGTEARSNFIADRESVALAASTRLGNAARAFLSELDFMPDTPATLCPHGTLEDIRALVDGFLPNRAAAVSRSARDLAADEWNAREAF